MQSVALEYNKVALNSGSFFICDLSTEIQKIN